LFADKLYKEKPAMKFIAGFSLYQSFI